MLKLTEHVWITIFLLYKQKNRWNSDFRTFIAKFWIFAYFMQNIAIFRSGMFLWRQNYVTPWPIVLILVCMSREGPHLLIDTKINFIGVRFGKSREGVATIPSWLDVLQKIAWLDEGLKRVENSLERVKLLIRQLNYQIIHSRGKAIPLNRHFHTKISEYILITIRWDDIKLLFILLSQNNCNY